MSRLSALSRRTLLASPLGLGALAASTSLCAAESAESPMIASPTDFGAAPGPGIDNTSAFEKALSRCSGGALLLPPGIFNVRGNTLRMPANTSVLGYGRGSVLRRIGDGTLLDISGASTSDRNGGCLLRDVVFDGADRGGPLVRCHHAYDLIFDNVWFRHNYGIALDAVELWDSRFLNCTWDWCSGTDGESPAVLMRNRERMGDSGEGNTNAVYFVNCRWESFRDGALWLTQTGPQTMSQIHLVNCKMETSYVRGPFLRVDKAVRDCTVLNLYLCGNSFDRGISTPIDLVEFSPYGMAKLDDVYVWLNAPVARTVIRCAVTHPSCTIRNVWLDGGHNPTHALFETAGPSHPDLTQVGYLKGSAGAIELKQN